jgi:hypothetical protein
MERYGSQGLYVRVHGIKEGETVTVPEEASSVKVSVLEDAI